jgi:hypothetical protein
MYELAAHESFLVSLVGCSNLAKNLEGPEFVQCIKAAGVNFNYSYDAFSKFKLQHENLSKRGQLE